jgi:hypothetical protein
MGYSQEDASEKRNSLGLSIVGTDRIIDAMRRPIKRETFFPFESRYIPETSKAMGFGMLEGFERVRDWSHVDSIFPVTFKGVYVEDFKQAAFAAATKDMDYTSIAMKCLLVDDVPGNALVQYECDLGSITSITAREQICHQGFSTFRTDTTALAPTMHEVVKMPNSLKIDSNDMIHGIMKSNQRYRLIKDAPVNIDMRFFQMLHSISRKAGTCVGKFTPKTSGKSFLRYLSRAFVSIERRDLVVNRIIAHPCHGKKFLAMPEKPIDLGSDKSLSVRWSNVVTTSMLWTAEVMIEPLCPRDTIFILPEPQYLGAMPIKGITYGMMIKSDFSTIQMSV